MGGNLKQQSRCFLRIPTNEEIKECYENVQRREESVEKKLADMDLTLAIANTAKTMRHHENRHFSLQGA